MIKENKLETETNHHRSHSFALKHEMKTDPADNYRLRHYRDTIYLSTKKFGVHQQQPN